MLAALGASKAPVRLSTVLYIADAEHSSSKASIAEFGQPAKEKCVFLSPISTQSTAPTVKPWRCENPSPTPKHYPNLIWRLPDQEPEHSRTPSTAPSSPFKARPGQLYLHDLHEKFGI